MTTREGDVDIGGWLRTLGLEQYEAAFRDNAITEKVLPNLTAEDLKELGVGMVATAARCSMPLPSCALTQKAKAPPPEAPSTLAKTAQDIADHRQVTVMFSDLVGSTALSARMDPEDLREVISAYQKCVAETVQRFGGCPPHTLVCRLALSAHRRDRRFCRLILMRQNDARRPMLKGIRNNLNQATFFGTVNTSSCK
jgi:SAM domain (Sterile alpha motif)/Adenylate and Guanylate cyclase catalytic domain